MKLAHKILGGFWTLFGVFVIVAYSNSIASNSSREIESRQKWKEDFSYPTWKGGDYYHDRKIDGEVFTEFCIGDYNRAYSGHTYWIKLLISKDSPPTKFKSHFGHWDKIEQSSRVKKNEYIKPYALFYTDKEIITLQGLKNELEQWYRKRVFFNKKIALLAIRLSHPERTIQEARVCFPNFTDPDPIYDRDKHLSESTSIALHISEPLSIEEVNPLPPISDPPPKFKYVTQNVLGYLWVFFIRGKAMFFSLGLVAIIVSHFMLSKQQDTIKNKSKMLLWIIMFVSYICVIGHIYLYIIFGRAMAAF